MKKFSLSICLFLLINLSFFLFDTLLLKVKKTPKCKKAEQIKLIDSTDKQILDNFIYESECLTDDGPFWISEDSLQQLKNKKFETIKIIDHTPKIKKKRLFMSRSKNKLTEKIKKEIKDKKKKILLDDDEDQDRDEDEDGDRHDKKLLKNKNFKTPVGKNIAIKLIKSDINSECKLSESKIKDDIKNNQSRLKELQRLTYVRSCNCINHPNYKLRLRVSEVEKFFYWLFKGFKSVKGGYKITKEIKATDKNNSTIVYSEDFNAKIECMTEKNSSIDLKNFEILKEKIYNIDYIKYKESMISVVKTLTKISNQLKNFCKGNEFGIDVISTYILNIKKNKLKKNLLDSVDAMKTIAFKQLDKNSFAEAGYTLGKIIGRGKIFGVWIYDNLENIYN